VSVKPLSAGARRGAGWRDVKVADPRVRVCKVGAGNLHLMIVPSEGRARQAQWHDQHPPTGTPPRARSGWIAVPNGGALRLGADQVASVALFPAA
jgi:hypothetical protein